MSNKKIYDFIQPFDMSDTNKLLELVSTKDISELLDGEIDVFKLIYEPVGLTKEDLLLDIKSNIKILTFKDNSTNYIDIPSKYVKDSSLSKDGTLYQNKTITIELGSIPIVENLDTILEDLSILIEGSIGIEPRINILKVSSETMIGNTEHNLYEVDRELRKSDSGNFRLALINEKSKNEDLLAYIKSMEDCAKENV